MKEYVKNNRTQIFSLLALIIVMMPNLVAIRYAIFTPDDFALAVGTNNAGNMLSIVFGKLVNPMTGLNYGLLRFMLVVLHLFFVFSFFAFACLLIENLGVDCNKATVFAAVIVGSFLFFKENFELFFWWTGAIFYELPIALVLFCMCLYLVGKARNKKILKIVAIVLIVVIFLAYFNLGSFRWMKENKDEDINCIKAIYYTLCVVENELKNYTKKTGMILVLVYFFIAGLMQRNDLNLFGTIKQKIWWIIFPFLCVYPIVFCRNAYNIERLPNRGEALIDLFLVLYLTLAAFSIGVCVKNKIGEPDKGFMRLTYVFVALCAVVFAVNLKNASGVVICKNLVAGQIQSYSDTWSSIYYICDTTNEADLEIETSIMDRVEGCCYPKLRSKTTSDKNQAVAKFFGLNTLSLNNTYKD